MAATYDPKAISVIVGSHIVQGYADGTFVSVERNSDTWSRKTGASGETARAKSNDRSGRIVITLMQTSPSNDYFSGLALADELKNAGKVPVLVKDSNGTTIHEATEAWLVKPANSAFGKEIADREWTFETGELVTVVGGSSI